MAHILIVDDDASIRYFLAELLERDGHQVTSVDSGEAALMHIETTTFDMALVDLRLNGGMSGTDVLALLHQHAPDTVVIMLTGHGSLDSAVEALRKGAHDYLFKPCKTLELRESIRRGLLKRRQKQEQRALLLQLEQHLTTTLQGVRAAVSDGAELDLPPLPELRVALTSDVEPPEAAARFVQHDGLIVDFMRHVITLDGQLLEISPTEFNILAYLLSEAPRIVSAPELLREIEGYASNAWEARNIIRYHIYRIRQKVKEASGGCEIIQTVRGVGYTIAVKRKT